MLCLTDQWLLALLHLQAFGIQPKTHTATAGPAAPGIITAALQRKRSSDVLIPSAGPARSAAAAAVAAAVKRTRSAGTAAAAAPATGRAAQGSDHSAMLSTPTAAAQDTVHPRRGRRPSHGSNAAAATLAAQHEANIPLSPGEGEAAAAEGGVQSPVAAANAPGAAGRVRGRQGHFAVHSSAAGAAINRQATAAAAENNKLLADIDNVIQQVCWL